MFDIDRWREIFQTIQKNKLRTFLSGFTVTLGILIFVILFGMGNGLKNMFVTEFMDESTTVIFVRGRTTELPFRGYKKGRQINYKNEDLKELKQKFGDKIKYISPNYDKGVFVRYKSKSNSYRGRAASPAYQLSEKTIIMKGRYLNEEDIRKQRKVAVIGRLVEKDLFDKENALGKYINYEGSTFKVVGVFQDDGGSREERRINIPYSTRQLLEKNTDITGDLVVGFNPNLSLPESIQLAKDIKSHLQQKYGVNPKDSKGITTRNTSEDVSETIMIAVVLQIIVSFVGIGTLLAGIIGISNIMVFIVKERTKELGIRKALGASPMSIVAMILQESIFITTMAGLTGLIIGVYVLNSMGTKLKDYFIINPSIDIYTGLFATAILIAFGAVAGYIPARRAARIKPIVALRDE